MTLVDLSHYLKGWTDDRFNWKVGDPGTKEMLGNSVFADHMFMTGIWWIHDKGGSLSDLRFDRTKGGIGKFDKHGNKVIIRQW